MLEALQQENINVLTYININDADESKTNSNFLKQLDIERNNITEPNEKNYVDNLTKNYSNYYSEIKKLLSYKSDRSTLYKSELTSLSLKVNNDLHGIITINERSMDINKSKIKTAVELSIFYMICFSIVAILVGFIISNYFINKFLKPIYALSNSIKGVKEGHLYVEAPILSRDELGEMTKEFNKMISRLKQFENSTSGQLMAEKNKSIAIVKSISDPLVVLNTDYKFMLLNNAFEKFFKIEEQEVMNKPFLHFIENRQLFNHIRSVIELEKENSKIIEFYNNGEEYYYNVIVTLVKDMNSKITGVIVLFQNITSLKQLEKMKTNFISTISHEFKTPLTSIMIGTSLIIDENIGTLNEKQKSIVTAIIEDSEKLSELVTNLLQLSKMQSDKEVYNFYPCSILGIIENCAKNFYERVAARDINLYYEADDKLPKVMADSEKISWVINNLISNALKYTNAGDDIIISAYVKRGEMEISIKDTGAGIPEQYKEKIFDKFVQVIGSDSESRGSGLGLTISKEIVESHKGQIWCESELDSGSTFTFTLPLA